jgi:O-antigen ligase
VAGLTLLGALAAISPVAAISLVGLLWFVVAVDARGWVTVAAALLAGLALFSYGFNNVAVQLPGARVPLVDVMLPILVLASAPSWTPVVRANRRLRQVLTLTIILTIWTAVRVIIDMPRFGLLAARDAVYAFEAWGIFVGIGVAARVGPARLERGLGVLWRVAVVWFLLMPVEHVLIGVAPMVGVQRPTSLVSFAGAGFVAAIALFWFLEEGRRSSLLFAALAAMAVVFVQARGIYLGVALAGLTVAATGRGRQGTGLRIGSPILRAGLVVLVVVGILALLPPIPGRLGIPAGIEAVAAQLGTLAGADGPGMGSLVHRARQWPLVVEAVLAEPLGWLIGIGFGPDLFGGFQLHEVLIRKPHNDLLEIWARAGLVGVLPFVLLLAKLFAWGMSAARRHPHGRWVVALHVLMVVVALTQPFFSFAYGGLVYFLLCGMAIGWLLVRDDAAFFERTEGP